MPIIKIKKRAVSFTDQGAGKAVVLLHGFTESSKIWDKFTGPLAKKYRVITIDLPGHGKSAMVAGVHSMELMAEVVCKVLKAIKAGKCIMVGHSMGGYVTLAFAAKYPEMLKGFCLFHSHCYPDSPEDRKNRDRTIAAVGNDRLGFMAQFIPGLFPLEVHKKFSREIERLIQRAAKMEKEGVIAALEGMKIRRDQSGLLAETCLPVLFILGQKDSRAPLSRLWEMVSLPRVSQVLLLRDAGHMGFIEAPEETLGALAGFIRRYL